MGSSFWKKVATSVFAGGVLFMATPMVVAHAGATVGDEYDAAAVHNVAVPLSLGRFRSEESFGGKLKVNFGHDFLMVRNEAFEKYRPACCDSILEYSRQARKSILNTLTHYEEMASSFSEPERVPYSAFESIEVRRTDARVVSLLATGSSYTGGAHGMYGVKGTSFDSVTGAMLKLGDVCRDISRFIDIVDKKIDQQYEKASFFDRTEHFANLQRNNGENVNWVLGYEGITVYFNPYEIASYADGIISVTVPFVGNEELFDAYYTKVPDVYALTANHPIDYGFKMDGSFKRFRFFSSVEDEGKNPCIVIGNNRLNDTSIFADEISPLFVHLDGVGEDYLYVFIRRGEYYQLNIYRLTGSTPEKVDEIKGIRRAVDKLDFDFTELCTKPESMILERITNEIDGTYTCGVYMVGADGLPILLREMK